MPTQKVLFVITDKSEMERWDITRSKININNAMIEGLTANLVRTAPDILPMTLIEKDLPGGIGIALGPKGMFVARMQLAKLPMHAPFLVEGPSMSPVFDGQYPYMKQEWLVPENMRLYLAVMCSPTMDCLDQFLVAIDAERRTWRLPVSNLYAECRLCAGRFDCHGKDLVDLLKKVWTQFNSSMWNSDLFGDSSPTRRSSSKLLFAYDISNEKITQRTPPKKWQDLCEKAATEFITQYINY